MTTIWSEFAKGKTLNGYKNACRKKKIIIGAGHCGQGLAKIFEKRGEPYRLIHHTDSFEEHIKGDTSLVINAAGIGGVKKCEMASESEVLDAHVHLPYELAEMAKTWAVPCVLISTGSVYAKPDGVLKTEGDQLYPHNLYVESKIKMEQHCQHSEAIIFRLTNLIGDGSHPNDYKNRMKSWSHVVDTWVATLRLEFFAQVLNQLIHRPDLKGQLFNIADPTFTYLPTLAPGLRVIDRTEESKNASVSHLLDIGKLWKSMNL